MKVPEAGWISIRKKDPLVFVPLSRFRSSAFPGMLPVILGNHTEARIAIRPSASGTNQPGYAPARIKKLEEKKYQLGPFVAILTSDGGVPFHGNHHNFADIILTGRTMGVTVFVLTPRGIEKGSPTVSGWLLDHRSPKIRWIPARLPFPNVVYNRVPNRKAERKREMQEAFRILQEMPGVQLFNPSFFDKWTLYKHVHASEELSAHLPATLRLDSASALERMAAKHRMLYLKPVEGKAGINMMRITATKGGVELIHQNSRGKRRICLPTISAMWPLIQKLMQRRPYIVQQGIPLARFRDRPFDVRMLLQKDGTGEWGLTGTGIRVAGENAISTHVPMGGRIENPNQVFGEVFGTRADEIRGAAENLGLRFARFIESKQPSLLGELSIDMGIEQNGALWFFEANAKPMKFDEPEIRTRSLRRLIQYSLFLSGFSQAPEEENA